MFSAKVVVGAPPTAEETAVASPSPRMARPSTGSRSDPVISATALMCPVFSATRAITPGSTRSAADAVNVGACMVGRPNHGAEAASESCTRRWRVTSPVAPAR